MKKIILFILSVSIALGASAQAQLKTKKFVVSDFREKPMKVVLTGNEITDAALRESLQTIWHISPYEFCSQDQFTSSLGSEDYYYMTIADARMRKEAEAGIKIIGIYKGTSGAKDLSSLYKVLTIPFCSAENPDGRETVFLPAMVSVLQDQMQAVMDRTFNFSDGVYTGLKTMTKKWSKSCAIATEDFARAPGESMVAIYAQGNLDVVDHDTIEQYLSERDDNYMVGYVVAPTEPAKGSVCYVMVFDASTLELAFMRKHKISEEEPAGFTDKDAIAIMHHNDER